jgi:glycosyltransferase involved in cell wall biosynthesis
MLETYGKDKGVRKAFNELKKLSTDFDFKLTLIGGPSEKIDEIIEDFQDNETEFDHLYKIPKYEVPDYMKSLDIGIVPYPDDYHMSNYASPLKIFEYAASGAVVIASDIKSNLELKNFWFRY